MHEDRYLAIVWHCGDRRLFPVGTCLSLYIISVSGCYSIINRHCLHEALQILANKTRPSQCQQYQRRCTHILNRRGGSNLQDKYSNIGGFTQHHLIKKSISSANTIGAVINEMTLLHLFVMTSPFNKAVASGKGNRLFRG